MKITAIKAAVKNKTRCNIFVDEKYSFSLDATQLVSSGIFVGKEVTPDELQTLQKESAFGKAYMRALEYILRRPRTEKELRDYGWRKEWEPGLTERVIVRLKNKGYLNDEAFAATWLQHRASGKPTSQRKLQAELSQKGVAKTIIEKVLTEAPVQQETNALQQIIAKKSRLARYQDEQKLIAYLLRQGFSYDNIKNALQNQ